MSGRDNPHGKITHIDPGTWDEKPWGERRSGLQKGGKGYKSEAPVYLAYDRQGRRKTDDGADAGRVRPLFNPQLAFERTYQAAIITHKLSHEEAYERAVEAGYAEMHLLQGVNPMTRLRVTGKIEEWSPPDMQTIKRGIPHDPQVTNDSGRGPEIRSAINEIGAPQDPSSGAAVMPHRRSPNGVQATSLGGRGKRGVHPVSSPRRKDVAERCSYTSVDGSEVFITTKVNGEPAPRLALTVLLHAMSEIIKSGNREALIPFAAAGVVLTDTGETPRVVLDASNLYDQLEAEETETTELEADGFSAS